MTPRLTDRVALVIGAGGGFGSAIAEQLIADGAAVALASRNSASLEPLAKRISDLGGRVVIAAGDVRTEQGVSDIYATTSQSLGKPTIVIDSAAVPGPFGPIGSYDPEEWWSAMELHLKAPALIVHQALPEMLRQECGHFVLLASSVGTTVYPHFSAYSVGKGAQVAFVSHAAAEHPGSGVSFFAIQPGFAHSQMTDATLESPELKKWAPAVLERMHQFDQTADHDAVRRACAERCVQLVSGRYNRLSGKYISPEEDLDELLGSMENQAA